MKQCGSSLVLVTDSGMGFLYQRHGIFVTAAWDFCNSGMGFL
jgi:hypothetical protein